MWLTYTKSVTTDVVKNLLNRLCGYETQWMHDLLMNTSGYTTPIKPTSKHIIGDYCICKERIYTTNHTYTD